MASTAAFADLDPDPLVRLSAGLLGVLERLEAVVEGRETCTRCGCLCLAGEVCPGCRAGRPPL